MARFSLFVLRHGVGPLKLARRAILDMLAYQRTWELMSLIRMVRKIRPAVVVEIGTFKGGTLYCWSNVARPDALLVSIDLPGGDFGGGYEESAVTRFREFVKPSQDLHCLREDSHSPRTRQRLLDVLGGRPIDFLFIDGDHLYEGVRNDYEMYAPLVRKGGVVAFHDIVKHPPEARCEVDRFWNEVKKTGAGFEEFVETWDRGWGGIGAMVVA